MIVSEYDRDDLGRLKHILAKHADGSIGQRTYHYDSNGNLVRAAIPNHSTAFDYNPNGGIIGEYALRLPTIQECAALALPELDWQIPEHDMFLLGKSTDIRYFYDANGNRTVTELPDGQRIHHLYYGSGHLHGIMLDDTVIADIERDKLHREIQRTQGALTSRYELDPLGRLKKQIAVLNSLSESGKGKVAAGYRHTAVKRSYGYDKTGNLTHSTDQRSGTVHYEYDPLGQIKKAGSSLFAFDPAHNIIDSHERKVHDNRLAEYGGAKFFYDAFGNTVHKELADGTTQNLYYDVFHQLVKVETFKHNPETGEWAKETWLFDYDALGRRIGKGRLKNGQEVSDGLEDVTEFIWSGSRLIQEVYGNGRYTYIHSDPDSYEPLAQIHNYTNTDGETYQEVNYFHCDQIGIPREMTDRDGNLIWFGKYDAWGKLTKETNVTGRAHQPFRLQNQYCDRETGLHYNFFRYYDPDIGRFVNQDPIGLLGGSNLYIFINNTLTFMDPLGLNGVSKFIDSSLTGTHVEGSATLGVGLSGECEYAGNGKLSCSIAITSGVGIGASIGKSHTFIGDGKKDGGFVEICGTAKFKASVSVCTGSNLEKSAKPYVTGKAGIGYGLGVNANIGYQKTFDLKRIATPPSAPDTRLPPGVSLSNGVNINNMHPNAILNMKF